MVASDVGSVRILGIAEVILIILNWKGQMREWPVVLCVLYTRLISSRYHFTKNTYII